MRRGYESFFFSIPFHPRHNEWEREVGFKKNRCLINSLADVTHRRLTSGWCTLSGDVRRTIPLRNRVTSWHSVTMLLRPFADKGPFIRDRSIESIAAALTPRKRKWVGSHCFPSPLARGEHIHRERDRGICEQYDQPQATPGRTLFIAQQFTTRQKSSAKNTRKSFQNGVTRNCRNQQFLIHNPASPPPRIHRICLKPLRRFANTLDYTQASGWI